jgi:hypothetical protein
MKKHRPYRKPGMRSVHQNGPSKSSEAQAKDARRVFAIIGVVTVVSIFLLYLMYTRVAS